MTDQEKETLLRDLCAMYPYKVICEMHTNGSSETIIEELHIGGLAAFENGTLEIKPYLRPLSSMTLEERRELRTSTGALFFSGHIVFPCKDRFGEDNFIYEAYWRKAFEWLDVRHFDYRGLIERDLAIVAPDGMYI